MLDRTAEGLEVGCEELWARVQALPRLRLRVFGHIHEAYGVQRRAGVTFVNACNLDLAYRPVHAPIVLDM